MGGPAVEPLPIFSTVFTSVDLAFGPGRGTCLAPGLGVVFRGGDKHKIGVLRIPHKAVGVNIRRPVRAGPTFPTAAAGVSDVEPGATGDVDSFRVARIDQTTVHVVKV